MLSLKKALTDIANKFQSFSDYIINSGTTDGWQWEEYANGTIKAWYIVNSKSVSINSGTSPVFYASAPAVYTVPSFISNWTAYATITNSSGFNALTAYKKSDTQVGVYFVQFYGAKAGASLSYIINIVGTRA